MFPIDDWQFWVVTLVALWVGWRVIRSLLPKPKATTKVTLTVNRGKPTR